MRIVTDGKRFAGEKESLGEYLLFCGCEFYPLGGWEDFKGYFFNVQSAKNWILKNEPDPSFMWAHIVYQDVIISSAQSNNDYIDKGEWKWVSPPSDLPDKSTVASKTRKYRPSQCF